MKYRFLLLTAVLGIFGADPAQAQFDPGASMDLGAGMGSIALGQSILGGTRNLGKGRGSDELSPTMKEYCAQWPNEGVCKADRSRRHNGAMMRAIAPEYNRRVRLYGKTNADR